MPTHEIVPGAPCWADLQTSDPDRAREFYSSLLGWTAEEPDPQFGGYFNFLRDGGRIAGCMKADAQAPVTDIWSIYLAVDDAEKTTEAATAAGGQVVVPPMQVGDFGTMGFLVDPAGAGIGIWKPGTHRGFAAVAEHGAPGWFELLTRDYAAALTFYRDVFGWRTQTLGDTDEFRYTVLLEPDGDAQLAGVMDASSWLPEGVPPHWSVYFAVDDTDVALTSLAGLGGSVVRPAEDTPYGRVADVRDPMGGAFKLVGPNDQMPARQS